MQFGQTLPYAAPQPLSAFGNPRGGTPPTSQQYMSVGQLPAFQPSPVNAPPAMPPTSTFPEATKEKPSAGGKFNTGLFLTVLGAFLLLLVALTPIWDAVRMAYNSTFVYFIGRAIPFWTIILCAGLVGFFIFAMLVMELFGRREVRKDESFLYLFTLVVTVLGLGLLLLSVPLQMSSKLAYNELMVNCQTSPMTAPLYTYYSTLLQIRMQPDCINKPSIEQCTGFQEHPPYTGFLKYMESTYQCSGFGYTATKKAADKANPAGPQEAMLLSVADSMTLLQTTDVKVMNALSPGQGLKMSLVQALQGHASGSNETKSAKAVPLWEKIPKGVGNTANNMIASGWMSAYPPTLFTTANFKTTCEGAAARDLRFTAGESATLMYIEGAILLVISVLVGFMKLSSMCRSRAEMDNMVEDKLAGGADADGVYNTFSQKIVL